jgi:hypothetical protein
MPPVPRPDPGAPEVIGRRQFADDGDRSVIDRCGCKLPPVGLCAGKREEQRIGSSLPRIVGDRPDLPLPYILRHRGAQRSAIQEFANSHWLPSSVEQLWKSVFKTLLTAFVSARGTVDGNRSQHLWKTMLESA